MKKEFRRVSRFAIDAGILLLFLLASRAIAMPMHPHGNEHDFVSERNDG